jgi:hypothetical protein
MMYLLGFANTSTRSTLGFLEATAKARVAPKVSPTRYIGFDGDFRFSDFTTLSTILINPVMKT